jgi:hypothetical protein
MKVEFYLVSLLRDNKWDAIKYFRQLLGDGDMTIIPDVGDLMSLSGKECKIVEKKFNMNGSEVVVEIKLNLNMA